MKYQILNDSKNPKRNELLRNELERFKKRLEILTWRSHTVFNGLREIEQQKKIEEKIKELSMSEK